MTDFDLTILQDFLSGTASEEQERLVCEWLESSEENRRFFAEFTTNTTLHETVVNPDFDEHREDMLVRLNSRIDASEKESTRRAFSFASAAAGFLAAMAVAAVVALCVILPRQTPVQVDKVEPAVFMHSYANTSASVKSVLLADGTKIFLKPGSELEYNVTGYDDKREVVLRGEGYFDVAKDSLRPMFVHTENLSLKVLGTAFSVKTNFMDEKVEVVLERGSVRLLSPEGTGLVRLSPNQMASYDPSTGDLTLETLRAVPFIIEQFNLESLDNVTVSQIIRHLEHIYGVRIESHVKHPETRYYFNFLKTDTIDEVLNIVERLTGEKCKLSTNTY